MLGAVLLASLTAQAMDPAYTIPEPPGAPAPRAPIDGPADGPNTVSVTGRFAYRFAGTGSSTEGSAVGFAIGGGLEHRYTILHDTLELGVAGSFLFDQFRGTDGISNFTILQTAGVRVGPGRVSAAVGGGLAVNQSAAGGVDLITRALVGAEVPVRGRIALGLQADYTRLVTHRSQGDDHFEVGGALLYRF